MLKLRGIGVIGILAGFAFGAQRAGAQTVSISPITLNNNNEYNLTNLGPDGWIKWGSTNPNSGNYLSTTGQSFTTTAFGPGTNAFDNSFNGNNSITFTWTNGSSGDNSQIAGDLYRNPGAAGSSFPSGFTISVPTVGPTGSVQLFVANLGDAANLVAQLNNNSGTALDTKMDQSFDNSANPITGAAFETGFYKVNYSGAVAGDALVLTYSVGSDPGAGTAAGPGFIGIQAEALQGSAVPEPATTGLLGMALVAGCMRRRRST